MAESARGSESSDEDITSVMSTEIFMSLSSTSEVSSITFNNVSECYPPDRDLECRFTIKSSVKPSSRDWIGLFKVGWQSPREYYTYEWSPMPSFQGTPIANRVVFRVRYLPKIDDEFYQFCYVTNEGDVKGASAPFQIKTKPIEQEELECCEIEDDELGTSIMVVKNKTAMLEDLLARALEEKAALKASNEMAQADLANANDKVMESECRKAELTAALKENEKKVTSLEQALAQKDQALEEEQRKRRDLKSANSDLKTTLENLNRRVDLNKKQVELIHQLEQELEDANTQLQQETGKITTLEEDYEQKIRALQNQLEEEKALNQSLCSQADRNLASLQDQVQKQQETNMEWSQQLEGVNAEFKDVCDELDNCKKQLQSAEEMLQISIAQLIAVDTEVKSVKLEKETLQTALKDTRRASAQSAASMYALQTAYTHIKKKYLNVRKGMTELWSDRIQLKKTIDAPFNGSIPCDDLHLQLEEVRACNEDLRIRLNMGAEAFKKKSFKCHQLEEQLNKVTRTSSQTEEAGSALQMQKKVSKLRKALEEKKTLNIKKSLLPQKSDETYQNTEGSKSADQHENASLRNQAGDAIGLQLLQPSQVLQEHENFPLEMLQFQDSWQSRNRRPVRYCTQRSTNPRLVVYGIKSWYAESRSETCQTDQADTKQVRMQKRKLRNVTLAGQEPAVINE